MAIPPLLTQIPPKVSHFTQNNKQKPTLLITPLPSHLCDTLFYWPPSVWPAPTVTLPCTSSVPPHTLLQSFTVLVSRPGLFIFKNYKICLSLLFGHLLKHSNIKWGSFKKEHRLLSIHSFYSVYPTRNQMQSTFCVVFFLSSSNLSLLKAYVIS